MPKLDRFGEVCGWTKTVKFFKKAKNMFKDVNLPMKHHQIPHIGEVSWDEVKYNSKI